MPQQAAGGMIEEQGATGDTRSRRQDGGRRHVVQRQGVGFVDEVQRGEHPNSLSARIDDRHRHERLGVSQSPILNGPEVLHDLVGILVEHPKHGLERTFRLWTADAARAVRRPANLAAGFGRRWTVARNASPRDEHIEKLLRTPVLEHDMPGGAVNDERADAHLLQEVDADRHRGCGVFTDPLGPRLGRRFNGDQHSQAPTMEYASLPSSNSLCNSAIQVPDDNRRLQVNTDAIAVHHRISYAPHRNAKAQNGTNLVLYWVTQWWERAFQRLPGARGLRQPVDAGLCHLFVFGRLHAGDAHGADALT